HGSPQQAACVRQAIEAGGRDQFAEVLAAVRATGALEHALSQARREAETARKAISGLPDGKYRDALVNLTVFAVERNH
ncbi:MAG TPA: octaprenyl diphosphate synthase, partial [Rhodocyclaceae bacterium]|nr:octaprenyl diphosphate synthase [Rhodocyclaceae bacterium]